MRNTEPNYQYNPNTGVSIVEQFVDGKYIRGEAKVAESDKEFANEYTGMTIAEARMSIDYAKQHIEMDLKPQLFILNHLLGTMRLSPRFNNESYEAKRIYAERQNILDDIEEFKTFIASTKDWIKEYIEGKDYFYRQVEKQNKVETN